ncbi:MAG: DUF4326 domain-containing protein [Deltaproteobacteria bacterium]|nr:DUF4326 domain-containing protein [Deltaproteobacteria bacterium]
MSQFDLFGPRPAVPVRVGTVVVNLHREAYDVYIGRAGHGLDGYFGNPFTKSDPDCLAKFEGYCGHRVEQDAEFRERVRGLHGKRLGCFCAPGPCHGDILARWAAKLSASRVSGGGAPITEACLSIPSTAELETPSSVESLRNGPETVPGGLVRSASSVDGAELGVSLSADELRTCPACGARARVLTVQGGAAPDELLTTYLCPECDCKYLRVTKRKDVCAHGKVLFVSCSECPRTWDDVYRSPHFRPQFFGGKT